MAKEIWIDDPTLVVRRNVHLAMQGFVKWWVVNEKGEVVREAKGWQPNLILNEGMNTIGSTPRLICNCFTHAIASTGAAATVINGAPSTLNQTGQTVTVASGGFTFAAGDIGNTIQFNGGLDAQITAFVSTTNVTVNVAQSLSGVSFQVFQTNQSGASTFNAANEERTATYVTLPAGTGLQGTTWNGASTFTHIRTYDFPIRASTKSYAELGFGWSATLASATCFSRILTSGGAVTVDPGERLRVAYALNVYMSRTGGFTRDMAVVGWPIGPATTVSGIESLQLPGLSGVSATTGATVTTGFIISPASIDADTCNEPAGAGTVFMSTNSSAPSAFNNNPVVRATLATQTLAITPAYVTNTYYVLKRATFGAGVGTSTGIRSIGIGVATNGTNYGYVFVFDEAQTKGAGNSLALNYRFSWSRVLS